MAEVYVTLRRGAVARSECMGIAMTADYDEDGALLGIEILGAIDVTVDDHKQYEEGERMETSERPLGERILDLPMGDNDSGANTVRGYLCALLAVLWDEGECFGGKRPFGNSGWDRDLYEPLIAAGLLAGETEAEDDSPDAWVGIDWSTVDEHEGARLIRLAIEALAEYTQVEDEASRVVFGRG